MNTYYGTEPFDLKLLLLRILRKLPLLILLILAGTVVFGGAYYVKNIIFAPTATYEAKAVYEAEYDDPDWVEKNLYLNGVTVKTWLDAEEFRIPMRAHFAESYPGQTMPEDRLLDAMLSADMRSDLRIFETIVTNEDPTLAEKISHAVEQTMVEDFPELFSGVSNIDLMSPGVAKEIVADVRPARAFILAAVLSFIFVFAIFIIKELTGDGLWIPAQLIHRYGLPVAGAECETMTFPNLEYLLRTVKAGEKVSILPMCDEINPVAFVEECGQKLTKFDGTLEVLPAPKLMPQALQKAREAQAVVVLVPCGSHVSRKLEAFLDLLHTQDIVITAVVLTQCDERLLRFMTL